MKVSTSHGRQCAALFHQRTIDKPGTMAQRVGFLFLIARHAITQYNQHIYDWAHYQQRNEYQNPNPKLKGCH